MDCPTYTPTLLVHRCRSCEYKRRTDLVRGLFEPPTTHSDPEDDYLWRERLAEREGQFSKIRTRRAREVSIGGLRLNAEHVPDKGKRRDERSILGGYYDETDPNDRIRRRGLYEHCDHACIHC